MKAGIHPNSEKEAFLMMMGDAIDYIVHYTNLQGHRTVALWNRDHPQQLKQWIPVDTVEMEAFIGLMILAGAYKAQYRPISELWSLREGQPVFRATMTANRFKSIKGALRFDDPLRRNREDRLAPIRDIFELVKSKFKEYTEAADNLTIDEQLLEFHGRVHFRQHISSKPGKFGIKIYWLTEAASSYCLDDFVYIGADSIPEQVVADSSSTTEATVWCLMKDFVGKGRNLTGDNWFTTLPLIDRLRANNTTYVGTCRSTRRDIPATAKTTQGKYNK